MNLCGRDRVHYFVFALLLCACPLQWTVWALAWVWWPKNLACRTERETYIWEDIFLYLLWFAGFYRFRSLCPFVISIIYVCQLGQLVGSCLAGIINDCTSRKTILVCSLIAGELCTVWAFIVAETTVAGLPADDVWFDQPVTYLTCVRVQGLWPWDSSE